MRLNSRMQSVPTFVLVGSRNAKPSGLRLQNLVSVFHIESDVIFIHLSSSSNSSVSSFQIVSKFFSLQMHMNIHLTEVISLVPRGVVSNISDGGILCGPLVGLHTCVGCGLGPVPGDLLLM